MTSLKLVSGLFVDAGPTGDSVLLQRQPKSEKHAFLDAMLNIDHGVQLTLLQQQARAMEMPEARLLQRKVSPFLVK